MSERIMYSFGLHDFGAGGEVFTVIGPKGKKGLLRDYGVYSPTETFTNVTTGALVEVGNSGDPNAYGEQLDMGALADVAGGKSARTEATDPDDFRTNYVLEPDLPADTAIYVTCTAPTGGVPAGIAVPFVDIEWQD